MYKVQLFKYSRIIAFFLVVFGSMDLFGQGSNVSGEIRWGNHVKIVDPQSSKEVPVLYFENAVYNNPTNHFPYYQDIIRLTNEDEKVSIAFNNVYFEELTENDASLIPFLKDIADTILITYTIAHERKQPCLIYSFAPLRKNRQTGKIERLKLFSLKITKSTSKSVLKSSVATARFANQSVLKTGDWYKFYVSKSGVYQISYTDLKNLGLTNPENVRVYGNGGKILPEVYTGIVPDDLNEIPIMLVTGSDGVFNEGDYIVFYAEGPVTWSFNKTQNTFGAQKHGFILDQNSNTNKVSYFITSNPGGARILADTATIGNPSVQVNTFDGLEYYEKNVERKNLLLSGQAWYGEEFNTQTSYTFPFSFPNLITTEPVSVECSVLGRSGVENYFTFLQNNQTIGTVGVSPVYMDNSLTYYAEPAIFKGVFNAASDNFNLQINYINGGDAAGLGWLGYIKMQARENLSFSSSQFSFRDKNSVSDGNTALFSISNAPDNTTVWDITDINHVIQMPGSLQSKLFSFKAKTDNLREYVAFDWKNGLYTPELIKGKVENQNLHGLTYADIVIISHPNFMDQATRLANLHLQKDGLSSIIVTPDQIYNEFSSGMPDPAGIRNFMKMFYDRASSSADMPKYLLLFGDGSYDNNNPYVNGSANSNFIMTYEGINSLDPTNTFVSDDYFGLLADNETIVNGPNSASPYTSALLDIGIGRIPVDSLTQAEKVVDKIEKYLSHKSFGDWRNSICFVGDDEDDNIHMQQADQLATYVTTNNPTFNIEKIYLDAYQQVSTSTGQRYPDVNAAILNQLNRGLLIFNYTGHGGESGLAHEQIMQQDEDINKWQNDEYPLFVTATCDFARFDKKGTITAGEDVLLNPRGGGIGLLTTNRLVYSAPNFVLNQQFYNVAFVKADDNPAYRLGDIIRKTKNRSGSDINKLNFALLGDPALSLNVPQYTVVTDSVNHKPLDQADTLKAYGSVSIHGHVENENGILLPGYNGTVVPVIYDKVRKITTLANDGGTPFQFILQDKVLFKGKATVKNGEFSINFLLPRDMDYSYGFGRISYYASDSSTDASGYCNKIVTGGMSTAISVDSIGPNIRLFMNDTTFMNGGITDEYPTLLAKVSDEHGINPGGNSIGHDIKAILDNNSEQTYILNSYFEADLDNYKKGAVTYKFPQLSPGNHTVTFKIWDIFNNSSQSELNFYVVGDNSPNIQHLYNYPNPFSDNTNFFFEHNQAADDLDVTIEIFGMTGNKVREIKTTLYSTGYTSGPINWDGTDANGNKISGGIYIYRIILRSLNGTTISKAQKMIVIRH